MTEEEYYARIKAEYEASTDAKLVEWARPYFDGTKKPNGKNIYRIGPVSETIAECIRQLNGSDIRGFTHCISADEVAHIHKKHGETGISDNTISNIDDLGRLAFVLNNADKITLLKDKSRKFKNRFNQKADIVLFEMRIDGHVFTSEAVTDSKNKMLMCVNTMYKNFVKNTKKESQVPDARKSVLVAHVRNELGSSTSILPQPEKNVNSLEEKSFDPPDSQAKRQRTADDGRAKIAAEMAEIKAELRGKSPSEIAEMSRQARQKNKQNGNNANGNGCKPSSGNGSGGNSGR